MSMAIYVVATDRKLHSQALILYYIAVNRNISPLAVIALEANISLYSNMAAVLRFPQYSSSVFFRVLKQLYSTAFYIQGVQLRQHLCTVLCNHANKFMQLDFE